MLRFAPSPNGPLHLGHALSALTNQRMAEALGRPLGVRIEDIDRGRSRPEHEAAILTDLAWLGVVWEAPVHRQSERFPLYAEALDRLRARGLVYPSFATRREIAEMTRTVGGPRDPEGAPLFPGDAAVLGEAETVARRRTGEPAAWRLSMDRALALVTDAGWHETDALGRAPRRQPGNAAAWGDVVLARKETPTSYHLSVVVDDAEQGISHVVRGADLTEATAVHRVLQQLLGLPAPLYHHHPLVLDETGRKLSKSAGAQSLAALREAGATPAVIRAGLVSAGLL